SGRPSGCDRTSTCHSGWGSMQSTRMRAYAWMRVSTRRILVGGCEPEPGADDGVGGASARWMPGHRLEEVVPFERVQASLGLGLHRRRARHVVEQRDLPERVAGAELAGGGPVHEYAQAARLDDVEAVAVIALSDDRGAGLRLDGLELRSQALEGGRRQRREDR